MRLCIPPLHSCWHVGKAALKVPSAGSHTGDVQHCCPGSGYGQMCCLSCCYPGYPPCPSQPLHSHPKTSSFLPKDVANPRKWKGGGMVAQSLQECHKLLTRSSHGLCSWRCSAMCWSHFLVIPSQMGICFWSSLPSCEPENWSGHPWVYCNLGIRE